MPGTLGHQIGDHESIDRVVVDDEADSRDLLMTILTQCGGDVHCSDSADAAMQEFNDWNPDILVSDIGMPNEDGYALIRKVRALDPELGGAIPAIALTAFAGAADQSHG